MTFATSSSTATSASATSRRWSWSARSCTLRRHLNGRPAVGVDVFKSTQANIVQVVDRVLEAVEQREAGAADAGHQRVRHRQPGAGHPAVARATCARPGSSAARLAFIVLFLFLRHWPTTLIVSLAVPLSLLCTLAALYFFGLSINVHVDDGHDARDRHAGGQRRRRDGKRLSAPTDSTPGARIEATLAGVREVGVATLAGTATCVVVFLPILFGDAQSDHDLSDARGHSRSSSR